MPDRNQPREGSDIPPPSLGLRHVFRMIASDKFRQELVALVLELLVDADLARVVAEDRPPLRFAEKLLERRGRIELVLRGLSEDRRLMFWRGLGERLTGLRCAGRVERRLR